MSEDLRLELRQIMEEAIRHLRAKIYKSGYDSLLQARVEL